ncbi:hypothetical protein BH18ACT4_BH18ACT4_14670 [soil metagenome]
MGAVTDEKTPLDQALDLLFYAPLGLLMNAEEVIPDLVERGRQQVTMARLFGQFAVQQGQAEAAKTAERVQNQAAAVIDHLGDRAGRRRPAGRKPDVVVTDSPPLVVDEPTPSPVPRPTAGGPAAAALSIPDYDSLSASQVVPRLAGLSPEELEAVRVYEAAHRGRKTILNKVTQLQG